MSSALSGFPSFIYGKMVRSVWPSSHYQQTLVGMSGIDLAQQAPHTMALTTHKAVSCTPSSLDGRLWYNLDHTIEAESLAADRVSECAWW